MAYEMARVVLPTPPAGDEKILRKVSSSLGILFLSIFPATSEYTFRICLYMRSAF